MICIQIETITSYWTGETKYRATWSNGEKYWFKRGYKTSEKYFDKVSKLLQWAKENQWILDCHPGGGAGVGVMVYIGDVPIRVYAIHCYTREPLSETPEDY